MNRVIRCLPQLLLALAASCSSSNDRAEVPTGRLEPVWIAQPEETDREPWFGHITDVDVHGDRIYVADSIRTTVLVLDQQGNFVTTIGREGRGPGELHFAQEVTVSPSGTVFVGYGPASFTMNEYSPDGVFRRALEYSQIVGFSELVLETPVALDDQTMAWSCSAGFRFVFEGEAEQELESPAVIVTRGGAWSPLAFTSLDESADRRRAELSERSITAPNNSLVRSFTLLEIIAGRPPGEVIFAKGSDPYTVSVVREGQPVHTIAYLEVPRTEWARVIRTPREEYTTESREGDTRRVGEQVIGRGEVYEAYTFTHSLRGMALMGEYLALYVEVLSDDFPNTEPGSGIEQKVYVVDLDTERIVRVVPLSMDGPTRLCGALEGEVLVFSVFEPYPGLAAFRIVPAK